MSSERCIDKENVAYTYIMEYLAVKEGNLALCNNMDEFWEHEAKWNKSEKYNLYSHLYVKSKKKPDPIETENRLVDARGRMWGLGEMGEGGHSI